MNPHLAANRRLELDQTLRHRRRMRRDHFNECRRGCLLFRIRNAVEPLLQPRIVQPQRMSDRIHAMLPGQLHRSPLQRLRQLRPMRPGAAKLIQPSLQVHDW